MNELNSNELVNINGGERLVDSKGVYFLDYSTGKVYNIAGEVVLIKFSYIFSL